ncbi:hypothetical protein [Trebonia kvetii]|nr:hypothetical protein [Trebonia kvetii]
MKIFRKLRKRCKHCRELIMSDGYGEPVHSDTNRYACKEGDTLAE